MYFKKPGVNLCVIFLLIVFSFYHSVGQETQLDELNKSYREIINTCLIPSFDTTKFTESLCYIEKPSFSPEYSIRILKSKNEIWIEGYFFKTSFSGHQMMNLIENRKSSANPVVTHHSILIDSELNAKIFQVVELMIDQQYSPKDIVEIPVDGTDYLFNISKKSKDKHTHFHSSELYATRKEVVDLFSQISVKVLKYLKAKQAA